MLVDTGWTLGVFCSGHLKRGTISTHSMSRESSIAAVNLSAEARYDIQILQPKFKHQKTNLEEIS